jgi:hypothetical protein
VGPLVVAVAASALLVAGPASAQTGGTPPTVGSTECTALVNADPDVVAANQGSAGGLPAAKSKAEAAHCKPATPTTTTTTTTASSSSTAPSSKPKPPPPPGRPGQGGPSSGGRPSGGGPGGPPPNRPGRPAGDRDCPDFATQDQAQRYFESIGGSSTNNADRLDENHNGVACESFFDDGDNQDAAVNTTSDDGSDATTSGNQVTDVPEGSAQTGGN